jgi:hypothetical protein
MQRSIRDLPRLLGAFVLVSLLAAPTTAQEQGATTEFMKEFGTM